MIRALFAVGLALLLTSSRVDAQVVSFERQSAGAKLGQRLQISPVDEVWVITRLRLADDETMAIEWMHAPRKLLPDLRREELASHSFYDLLRERYGITIARGVQRIEPTVTNEEESEALNVPLHSPAFLFDRTSRAVDGRIVEFVQSIYRGDRYVIVSELSLNSARGGAPVLTLRDGGRF